MNTRWTRGRTVWAAIAVVTLAAVAASVSMATPDERGYIGVYMQTLDRSHREGLDLKVDKGVLISGVEDDSPADKAGLQDGDVIVEFNGKAVDDPDALRDLVRDTKPGEKVEVVIIRDGDRKTLKLEVGERPEGGTFGWSSDDHPGWGDMHWFDTDDVHGLRAMFGGPRLGVTAAELNDDLAGYFDTKAGDGVLVLGVADDSIAKKAGIKSGDVIQKVGDKAIGDVSDLRKALRDFDEGDQFDVTLLRKGKTQTVKATMDDQQKISLWTVGEGDGDWTVKRVREHRNPRVRVDVDKDRQELHDAMNELRDEIKQLKKEIKELKKER